MSDRNTFQISVPHAAVGYGDRQFVAFASDLGFPAGSFPDVIEAHNPHTGNTIVFVREQRLPSRRQNSVFYRTSMATPAKFSDLTFLIFND